MYGWSPAPLDPDHGEDIFVRIYERDISTGLTFQVQVASTRARCNCPQLKPTPGLTSRNASTQPNNPSIEIDAGAVFKPPDLSQMIVGNQVDVAAPNVCSIVFSGDVELRGSCSVVVRTRRR